MLMANDRADDGFTIVVALRRFSKRFAEGKGGLSHDELACVTGLGSDRLARCLALLASQRVITSAVTEMNGQRLFYLTWAAIERLPANRSH
jgi:hypothetical protein